MAFGLIVGIVTYSNIHYDNEKRAWYATYRVRDENENIKEIIKEYVPPMSEYEIEKLINKFLKQENKIFSFSPSRLEMKIGDSTFSLELKDIADKVVIYDKFLTSESLYEKSNVGVRSIITCSAEENFGKYKETKYESNNFFYDICIQPDSPARQYIIEDKYEFMKEKIEKAKIEMNNKVEEYKNIAKSNPDKAYFLFLEVEFSEDLDFENNNLIVGKFKNRLIICDVEEKEQVLEKILFRYRYYNINYHNTIYEYLGETEDLKQFTTENIEKRYYDASTGKEYDIKEN